MSSYVVASDNFAFPQGTQVTDAQLSGCDIAALVSAGHLTPLDPPPASDPSGGSQDELDAAEAELAKAQADLAAAQANQQPPDPPATADPANPPKE